MHFFYGVRRVGEEIIEEYITSDELDELWDVPEFEETEVMEFDEVLSFSTDTADYHFYPGMHSEASPTADLMQEMDAMVLEEGWYQRADVGHLSENCQYGGAIRANLRDGQNPIYFVDTQVPEVTPDGDVDWNDVRARIGLIYAQVVGGIVATGGGGIGGVVAGHPEAGVLALPLAGIMGGLAANKVENDEFRNATAYTQISYAFLPLTGGRSALSAEKIDEFVAPKVAEDVGRRPDIYVEYGAGHLDIKPYLQHPTLRKSVMAFHDNFGYFPSNSQYTEVVSEIRFDDFDDLTNEYITVEGDRIEYQKTFYEIEDISSGYQPIEALLG